MSDKTDEQRGQDGDRKHSLGRFPQINDGLYKLYQAGKEVGQVLVAGDPQTNSTEDWFLYKANGPHTAYTWPGKSPNNDVSIEFKYINDGSTTKVADIKTALTGANQPYSWVNATCVRQDG